MPEVTIQPCIHDTWIDENDPGRHDRGSNNTFSVNRLGTGKMRDAPVKFDLATIPPGSQIETAVLHLYQTSCTNAAPMAIARILSGNSGWTEDEASWNHQDETGAVDWAGGHSGCHDVGLDIASALLWSGTLVAGAGARECELDATEFQALLDIYNYGFKLYLTQRGMLLARAHTFASSEHATGAWQPKLIITYTLPSIRLVKYYLNVWDKDSQIKDSEGRVVPPDEVEANNWLRLIGAGKGTSKTYVDLVADPTVSFIENVSYRYDENRVKIRASKESMLKAFLKRLGGVAG